MSKLSSVTFSTTLRQLVDCRKSFPPAAKCAPSMAVMGKIASCLRTSFILLVFDNAAGESRTVHAARAALNLLTFQCFSPGGRIGIARWKGKDTPGKGSSNHAPCTPSSMLHTLVLGGTLLESIARNLLTKQLVTDNITGGWGQPIDNAEATTHIANAIQIVSVSGSME